ncbi:RpiB/LacA/LacB family sugar-phosphate isomerase [Aquimarina agarivorans]|uniref:RpiB/LacA/LacB family sugar-phosphate isomerase n=1 Tax=Aquimarina agarivorans TaxID=980584 RepID=UPI000248FDA1|nr:RpiB/LacA/LacB family sugar-phosphate isomerase [Aquimarina agarivorans]
MKIAIGNDHAGTSYKKALITHLETLGHQVINHGTDGDSSVDYPDFAHLVAKQVNDAEVDLGILLCGSGNGVIMTANKYPKVRAGLCWNKEIAAIVRLHNNANILGIPARFTAENQVIEMVDTFLATEFEGGRHKRRIDKMMC